MSEFKPVGRFIEPGPSYRGAERIAYIRSYLEYSEANVADSNGYWLEGEKVFSQSQVFEMLAAAPTPPPSVSSISPAAKHGSEISDSYYLAAEQMRQPQPIYDESVIAWQVSGGGVRPKVYENKPEWALADPAYTVRELVYAQSRAKAGEDV